MSEAETIAVPPKTHTVESVETLHRRYVIQAPDRDTAVERLRAYWKDPEAMKPGIVSRSDSETISSRQVRATDQKPKK